MNLSLQDPFAVAKEYPETLTNTFHYGYSVVIQFNYKGDYLASGLSDGSILIYDLVSNGAVICHLNVDCHIRPITSLNWSRCGQYLLSSSQDWHCKLWDLSKINTKTKELPLIRDVKFDGPIWSSSLNPSNPFVFTASLLDDSPVYVDLTNTTPSIVKLPTTPLSGEGEEPAVKKAKRDKHVTLVTSFTNDGNYIFTGTSKGWVNIFNSTNQALVHSFKIANSNIKHLIISPNGRKLAINCSDRVIRQISMPDLINISNPDQWDFEVEHKYQDVVNRLQWNSVTFNHNGEFLVASTYGQSSHDLYVWETSLGSLVKILEGSNEELIDVKWNYSRCTIGSTGLDSGMIYLWSIKFPQKWSALAPDFVEIEENIEYEEKEDEFDIIDEDELNKKRLEEEDEVVDVITPETTDARGFDVTTKSFIIPVDYAKSTVV